MHPREGPFLALGYKKLQDHCCCLRGSESFVWPIHLWWLNLADTPSVAVIPFLTEYWQETVGLVLSVVKLFIQKKM